MVSRNIVAGWAMPEDDKYFEKCLPLDAPPKQNGFQKEHLMEAFKYVKKWDLAIDVGAHVGFWARDMAERFKKVHCFEPAAPTFECLEENTKDLDNVVLHNCAVGSKPGYCSVKVDPKRRRAGNTGSRFIMPGRGDIPIITLDSLGLKPVDFIKIDVEGFEYPVLKGAFRTIAKCRPVIIMECKMFPGRYDIEHGTEERYIASLGYKEVAHMRPDKVYVPT